MSCLVQLGHGEGVIPSKCQNANYSLCEGKGKAGYSEAGGEKTHISALVELFTETRGHHSPAINLRALI